MSAQANHMLTISHNRSRILAIEAFAGRPLENVTTVTHAQVL